MGEQPDLGKIKIRVTEGQARCEIAPDATEMLCGGSEYKSVYRR